MAELFDPVTGFFNLNFWIAGIACNMIGFGLVYLVYSGERKATGRSYFWEGTISLVIVMAGLSILADLT